MEYFHEREETSRQRNGYRLQVKRMKKIAALLTVAGLVAVAVCQEYMPGGHALFVRTSSSAVGKKDTDRIVESASTTIKIGRKESDNVG